MSVTAPFPGSAPITEKDKRQLRRYFEQTRPLPQLLATLVDYCVEHYGQCSAYFNPMQCNFGAVVHHVDPAFYERYYDGSTVTPAIRRHMQEWHMQGVPTQERHA